MSASMHCGSGPSPKNLTPKQGSMSTATLSKSSKKRLSDQAEVARNASPTLQNDFSSEKGVVWRGGAGVLLLLFVLMSAGPTFGQEDGSRPTPGEALSIKAPNPVAHLHSVAFKNTFDFGAPNGSAYFLNIIPIIPFTVGGWDVVNRPIIPIIDVSGFIAGTPDIPVGVPGDGAFGLGDINYTAYFSPSKDKKVDWGIGPSITFPSATDDQLGSGKWSAGPAAALFHMRKPWAFALLGRQLSTCENHGPSLCSGDNSGPLRATRIALMWTSSSYNLSYFTVLEVVGPCPRI